MGRRPKAWFGGSGPRGDCTCGLGRRWAWDRNEAGWIHATRSQRGACELLVSEEQRQSIPVEMQKTAAAGHGSRAKLKTSAHGRGTGQWGRTCGSNRGTWRGDDSLVSSYSCRRHRGRGNGRRTWRWAPALGLAVGARRQRRMASSGEAPGPTGRRRGRAMWSCWSSGWTWASRPWIETRRPRPRAQMQGSTSAGYGDRAPLGSEGCGVSVPWPLDRSIGCWQRRCWLARR